MRSGRNSLGALGGQWWGGAGWYYERGKTTQCLPWPTGPRAVGPGQIQPIQREIVERRAGAFRNARYTPRTETRRCGVVSRPRSLVETGNDGGVHAAMRMGDAEPAGGRRRGVAGSAGRRQGTHNRIRHRHGGEKQKWQWRRARSGGELTGTAGARLNPNRRGRKAGTCGRAPLTKLACGVREQGRAERGRGATAAIWGANLRMEQTRAHRRLQRVSALGTARVNRTI
jgi:hypothetical protein